MIMYYFEEKFVGKYVKIITVPVDVVSVNVTIRIKINQNQHINHQAILNMNIFFSHKLIGVFLFGSSIFVRISTRTMSKSI